jgi:glycosyltransferase involved in cell wall biosynthesis
VIGEMHNKLLERADLVYFSGRKLFVEEVAAHPNIAHKAKMLEQGVDYDHFSAATSNQWEPPEDIDRLPRPRLGYFGAVDSWLIDQELIRYVASRRPGWHWVLLGLRAARLGVEDLPNVSYLGSKPYSEMPRYAAQFDVCVLPWASDNEWVSYGSAIKVREYLATGKPVVITPLYEYERLDGILRISRGYDDFILKVEDALERDTPALRAARQAAVSSGTWDARAEQVSGDIQALDGGNSRTPDLKIS